jgi:hypothetical protein
MFMLMSMSELPQDIISPVYRIHPSSLHGLSSPLVPNSMYYSIDTCGLTAKFHSNLIPNRLCQVSLVCVSEARYRQ